jgi:hypothetical protein
MTTPGHQKNAYSMNIPYALFIGIDRSDKYLDFTVLDGTGNLIERGKVRTNPAALHPWMETWRVRVAVGACVVLPFEQPASMRCVLSIGLMGGCQSPSSGISALGLR